MKKLINLSVCPRFPHLFEGKKKKINDLYSLAKLPEIYVLQLLGDVLYHTCSKQAVGKPGIQIC